MMSKCLKLVKIQLSGQMQTRGKNWKIFLFLFLGLILCAYSYLLAAGLGAAGMKEVIPSYAIAITGVITLFFTILKTNGILFAYRDYDLLMSLPLKTGVVITSRFITMYLMNLGITAAAMISMGIGYVSLGNPGAAFYPMWLLIIILAPLIPTSIATLIGAVVIWISSRFRYANIATVIVSFLFVIAVLAGSMLMGNADPDAFNVEQLRNIGEVILTQTHRLYPPSALVYQAVVGMKISAFLLFAVISVAWYAVFIVLISFRYKSMNTGLMTFHSKSNYKLEGLKRSSPIKAMVKKEWKRFYTCPIYILNMGMGMLLAVLVSGACFLMGAEKLELYLGIPGLGGQFERILPFFTPVLLGMTSTTAVSLSLEGKSLWILKSIPMMQEDIYKGKICFNLLLVLPASLLCSVLLALRIPAGLLTILFLFVTPVVYGCFTSVAGMWLNLKMPNYAWTSETAVVKQSAASITGMMLGMLNGIAPILVLIFLPEWNAVLVTAAFTLAEGLLALLLWQQVKRMKF